MTWLSLAVLIGLALLVSSVLTSCAIGLLSVLQMARMWWTYKRRAL